jgi:translation elongation factor EF-4
LHKHNTRHTLHPGIEETLEAIVDRIPQPPNNVNDPLRALIFDSYYDAYRSAMAGLSCVSRRAARSLFIEGSGRPASQPAPTR